MNPALRSLEASKRKVSRMLRQFAGKLLTAEHPDEDTFTKAANVAARELADIMLGKGDEFTDDPFFRVGQIDEWVGYREGVLTEHPEERLMGGLLHYIDDLLEVCVEIVPDCGDDKELWKEVVDFHVDHYADIFTGGVGVFTLSD